MCRIRISLIPDPSSVFYFQYDSGSGSRVLPSHLDDDFFLQFCFIFKEVYVGSKTELRFYTKAFLNLGIRFIFCTFYFISCCITNMDPDPDPGETNQCGPHQDPYLKVLILLSQVYQARVFGYNKNHCLSWGGHKPQSRQSAKLFLQSSELGLPQPLTHRRVLPPPLWLRGEGHTRWRERGRESPNSNEGTYTTLWYSVYICTLWHKHTTEIWSFNI